MYYIYVSGWKFSLLEIYFDYQEANLRYVSYRCSNFPYSYSVQFGELDLSRKNLGLVNKTAIKFLRRHYSWMLQP